MAISADEIPGHYELINGERRDVIDIDSAGAYQHQYVLGDGRSAADTGRWRLVRAADRIAVSFATWPLSVASPSGGWGFGEWVASVERSREHLRLPVDRDRGTYYQQAVP